MDGDIENSNPCEFYKSNSPIQGFTDDQVIVYLKELSWFEYKLEKHFFKNF